LYGFRGSWLIAGVFAMAALYCVSYVYASVINKAVDREDLGFTNQEYGKLFLIVAASCDCWLLIGTIDDCLQVPALRIGNGIPTKSI